MVYVDNIAVIYYDTNMVVPNQPGLFKPKRKRRAVTIPPLVEEPSNEPKYKATDDDLPLIFWPEPDFDKEPK